MSLKIILPKRAVTRAVVRSSLVCALVALALALGCGEGETTVPILADSESVVTLDVPALIKSSQSKVTAIVVLIGDLGNYGWRCGLPHLSLFHFSEGWEDCALEPADSINMAAYVSSSGPAYPDYAYTVGNLNFNEYRNRLENDGAKGGGYLGFEVWDSAPDHWETTYPYAILEDRELVILGDDGHVRDVLTAFASGGVGFAHETDPLRRALDKAGDGLIVRASENCDNAFFPYQSSGCWAVAESFKGGDADAIEIYGVYLFRNERLAESILDDLGDFICNHDNFLYLSAAMTLDKIQSDGAFAAYRATLYPDRLLQMILNEQNTGRVRVPAPTPATCPPSR